MPLLYAGKGEKHVRRRQSHTCHETLSAGRAGDGHEGIFLNGYRI